MIYALAPSTTVKVCSRYTYGKPVQGWAQVSLCQKAYPYYGPFFQDICQNFTGQTDKSGCLTSTVGLGAYNLIDYWYARSLDAAATFVEDGTAVVSEATSSFWFSFTAGTVTFLNMDQIYHAGDPYTGTMKAEGPYGDALKNQKVYLIVQIDGQASQTDRTLVTDSQGLATFTLDTSTWTNSVNLQGKLTLEYPAYNPRQAYVYYQDAYQTVQPLYSSANSFLHIRPIPETLACGKVRDIQVDYTLDSSDLGGASNLIVYYHAMGKGRIIAHGQKTLSIAGSLRGSFTFSLTITSDLAPVTRILLYTILPVGGVTAASAEFQVSICFKNKVTVGFSEKQDLPGSSIDLQLTAAPGSLCAVRTVDKSVLLLRPESELSSQTIYNMFGFMTWGGYPYQVEEWDPNPCWGPPMPMSVNRRKRFIRFPWYTETLDVFSLFRDAGVKCLTNYDIKAPPVCRYPVMYESAMAEPMAVPEVMAAAPPNADKVMEAGTSAAGATQVRKDFPETWLWGLVPVGDSGRKQVKVTVPDSITNWEASMFCTSDIGFGISQTANVTAIKPFFLELTLPYSIVKGESFTLKATAFNYEKKCMKVKVTLKESQEFHIAKDFDDCQNIKCLCAEEAKTFSWNITAIKLGLLNFTVRAEALDLLWDFCGSERVFVPKKGRVDILIKSLLVKPEGVLQEKTHSSMLCPKGTSVSDSVNLQLPSDVVIGSARAQISVLGDIMGSTLQNLDQLIQLPTGCGEQNMIIFAPLVYTLQYLERTDQVTDEIRTRATGYLQRGYQQELNYKHGDGSYSAFGNGDSEGSTWLTIFVLKCFVQAFGFIYIDQDPIKQALTWLGSLQQPNGSFASVGNLFHTTMKGGVEDGVSLTAYAVSSFLEMGKSLDDPLVKNGLQFLNNALPTVSSTYSLALMVYTYTLANDTSRRAELFQKLNAKAIQSGGQKHWTYTTQPSNSDPYWATPYAADIEVTSYVALAYFANPAFFPVDLDEALPIVIWLTKQQSGFGGFSSTQDTVVGLQAFSKFATFTYGTRGDTTVSVTSLKGFQMSFLVTQENRLVLQQGALSDVPGLYNIFAS
ncbi:alpha-2-macroglobulin-like protein 1, partial [Rhinatrema bivittatum]|uniref:alpha-2-macroglobulin-like protein 1 n=1 Tax=Rhinatrema bivittatum TaxID=194408 RepID=UPI00112A1D07